MNRVSATISVGNCSKNPKSSNMCSDYCDKNNHNTADFRVISKFKQQKKDLFEAKSVPRKKSLASLFEEINELKDNSILKRVQAARKQKRNFESLLSTEISGIV
jgi:hypothetical protein